ncbi:hypothetical protein DES51_12217 [Dielma fastidiosa]|uniref:Uncharacterized protein n=2 Tax=Dielma fastidiosa TaxID=1034346 RepID=A0A318KJ31_9FIRM|nr:hypothetical protein DES51_12217 [Dielma fastidiosa]
MLKKGDMKMEIDIFQFLEMCEIELINQLCKNCPELTVEQIENIAEDFSKEIDKQLVVDGIIIGK